MAVKSIISIEVQDNEFKAFQALFERYNAALQKSPQAWAKVGAETKGAAKSMESVANRMKDQAEAAQKIAASQKESATYLATAGRLWSSISRDTRSVRENLASATLSLLKWTGITSAFSVALGGFGFDRLAASAAGGKRSAVGLGVSIGQQRSFGLNFGRFADTDSLLGSVSTGLYNPGTPEYAALIQAGISPQFLATHNAADVSAELLHRIPKIAGLQNPQTRGAYLAASPLGRVLDLAAVNRTLEGAKSGDLARQERAYSTDAKSLGVNGGTASAYQNFLTQLERAGGVIETALTNRLVGLAEPLEKLTSGFEKAAIAFINSPAVADGMNKLTKGLENFADEVATPDFELKIKHFAEGIGNIASVIEGAVSAISSAISFLKGGSVTGNVLTPWSDPNKSMESTTFGKWWNRIKRPFNGRKSSSRSPDFTTSTDLESAIIHAEGTGKGGRDPYNTVLGYGAYGTPSKPLQEMTMSEAWQFGEQMRHNPDNPYDSSARGAFQITDQSQREAQRALGIGDNELFDKKNQIRMMHYLATTGGRLKRWEGFKYHPADRDIAERALAGAKQSSSSDGIFDKYMYGRSVGVTVSNAPGNNANISAAAAGAGG